MLIRQKDSSSNAISGSPVERLISPLSMVANASTRTSPTARPADAVVMRKLMASLVRKNWRDGSHVHSAITSTLEFRGQRLHVNSAVALSDARSFRTSRIANVLFKEVASWLSSEYAASTVGRPDGVGEGKIAKMQDTSRVRRASPR